MPTAPIVPYEIAEHGHRFAVWAAARAAQRGLRGGGVYPLWKALESCGIAEFIKTADLNAIDVAQFDKHHRHWCEQCVKFLTKAGIPDVAYGRAASSSQFTLNP